MAYEPVENTIHIGSDYAPYAFYLALAHEMTHMINHCFGWVEEVKFILNQIEIKLHGKSDDKNSNYADRLEKGLKDTQLLQEDIENILRLHQNQAGSEQIYAYSPIFSNFSWILLVSANATQADNNLNYLIDICRDLKTRVSELKRKLVDIVVRHEQGEITSLYLRSNRKKV